MASRPGMEVLEGIEVLAGDAAALGQQGREVARPGAESLGLFQQHRMAGERLLEGFVKLTGFTPKSRYIVDGSSTQIQ